MFPHTREKLQPVLFGRVMEAKEKGRPDALPRAARRWPHIPAPPPNTVPTSTRLRPAPQGACGGRSAGPNGRYEPGAVVVAVDRLDADHLTGAGCVDHLPASDVHGHV